MENASKALIMAGGILIALLVIGALLLMFNQVSYYQKSQSSSTKTSQLADFNKEYEKFTYDDLKGYDLITLVNKVVDYNKKEAVSNSVNYDEKITLTITFGQDFAKKYGVSGKLKVFTANKYTIKDENNDFSKAITKFSSLENTYTLSVMSKLSANYDSIKSGEKTAAQVAGRNISITTEEIEQYREYSEFKGSTFRSDSDIKYYTDGQIQEMSFKFVK
jgi:hypothetical protein